MCAPVLQFGTHQVAKWTVLGHTCLPTDFLHESFRTGSAEGDPTSGTGHVFRNSLESNMWHAGGCRCTFGVDDNCMTNPPQVGLQ